MQIIEQKKIFVQVIKAKVAFVANHREDTLLDIATITVMIKIFDLKGVKDYLKIITFKLRN